MGSCCGVERAVGGTLITDLTPSSCFLRASAFLSEVSGLDEMSSRVLFRSETEILKTEVE